MSDEYIESVINFYRVKRVVEGCGQNGQIYIDKAYKIMEKIHKTLSDKEKEKHQLPSKGLPCKDDGTNRLCKYDPNHENYIPLDMSSYLCAKREYEYTLHVETENIKKSNARIKEAYDNMTCEKSKTI